MNRPVLSCYDDLCTYLGKLALKVQRLMLILCNEVKGYISIVTVHRSIASPSEVIELFIQMKFLA